MSGKSGLKRLPRNWCQSLLLVLTITGFGDGRICGVTKDREIKGWPRPGMYQRRNFEVHFGPEQTSDSGFPNTHSR